MPYKRIGRKIFTKSGGNWKLKQTAKTLENAKKTMRLLQGLEKGNIKKPGAKSSEKLKQAV